MTGRTIGRTESQTAGDTTDRAAGAEHGPADAGPLLSVRDLSVEFTTRHGPVRAVRGVDLALRPGQCLAVVGESGSGKSVTARTLVGLAGRTATVRAAELRFEGADLRRNSEQQWRRLRGARIGFVLQDALSSLDPLRRVGDEIAEPLTVHRLFNRRERAARVVELLTDVGVPEPALRARQYPHELSGGLRQRALIASAIAAGPPLLIADEPTTALDATVQAQVLDLLAARRDEGAAVLLISHDLTVVGRMADHVAVMYAGMVVEEGPVERLLTRPVHPYTADLLAAAPSFDRAARPRRRAGAVLAPPADGPGCPYSTRCALADSRCRAELPPLLPLPRKGPLDADGAADGGTVRCWHAGETAAEDTTGDRDAAEAAPRPKPRGNPAEPLIDATDLVKRFRSPDRTWRHAVDGVSFRLRPGEALGVVGESGSGKTTLAHLVTGMLAPDQGAVRLDGEPWSEATERARRPRRSRVQTVQQSPLESFDPRFSVERIVGEALGSPGRRAAAAERERITELLRRVGLDPSVLQRRGVELSGGQRQRVAIARALAPEPEIIVCDEPVSALDVSVQAQILDLFAALRADLGVALLFISHDLGVIREVCDRVLVMKDGTVVEEGDVAQVFDAPRHPYTQTLLAALTRTAALAGSSRAAHPRDRTAVSDELSGTDLL
ncbi:dipeptide ABC transporter ATP-binding protein [Streptomyces sp. WI04-05B]|uniref:ABC transporter ATP-binding protein n=1 Tax=Streptomyces TaxID=1883 RepID=UPI0029B5CABC|nr:MULTISPECIES: ABC transporter ATP-binding protein [unclassified Streptomyces]MDX2548602.1 ABC transporter ATP-binding protein [Streptomyces sp. WI04-05B]MDX2588090.1 ABC transporter ATP-binding protein [Streptomyces sp. WI04-05A]MDX3751728.1 ABC transporter ATP-binding protein [Streptomyces sp. AK08-02]